MTVRTLRVAAAGAVVMVACSSEPSRPAAPVPPVVNRGEANALNLARYAEEERVLILAERQLIRTCMQGKGFKYIVEVPSASDIAEDLTGSIVAPPNLAARRNDGYGLFSARAALQGGSGSSDGDNSAPSSTQDSYVRSLPQAQQQAYAVAFFGRDSSAKSVKLANGASVGYNTEGCVAEARAGIYGDVDSWLRLLFERQRIRNEIVRRAEQDERFQDSMEEWRQCMAQRGFRYQTPADAVQALELQYRDTSSPASVRDQEITTAVADAECDLSVGLATRFKSLTAEYEQRLSPDDQRLILAESESRPKAVERAKRVVGG